LDKHEVSDEHSKILNDWVKNSYHTATCAQRLNLLSMKTPAIVVLSTDEHPPNKVSKKWLSSTVFIYIVWDIKQINDVLAWSDRLQLMCHTIFYIHLPSPTQVPFAGPVQHVVPLVIFGSKDIQIFSDAASQAPDLISSPRPNKNERPPNIQTHLDTKHVLNVLVWQAILEKFHCLSNNNEIILDLTPAYGHLMVASILGKHRYLAFETSAETFRTISKRKILQSLVISNVKEDLFNSLPKIVVWKIEKDKKKNATKNQSEDEQEDD